MNDATPDEMWAMSQSRVHCQWTDEQLAAALLSCLYRWFDAGGISAGRSVYIIWHKSNPMPESVTDRPTRAHEYIFLLSKAQRYYYKAEAIAEPLALTTVAHRASRSNPDIRGVGRGGNKDRRDDGRACGESGPNRNARSVWTITTQPYPDAHFATFPEAIPERCIKAGSRVWDLVLDPFTGSGTTGRVALRLGREFVGCELNPDYTELARERIRNAAPLFVREQGA